MRTYKTKKSVILNRLGLKNLFSEDEKITVIDRRLALLRLIKGRLSKKYDELFGRVDAIYREGARFAYTKGGRKQGDGSDVVFYDFYTHKKLQEEAKERTFQISHPIKTDFLWAEVEYVFDGVIVFEPDERYFAMLDELNDISNLSKGYANEIDYLLKLRYKENRNKNIKKMGRDNIDLTI